MEGVHPKDYVRYQSPGEIHLKFKVKLRQKSRQSAVTAQRTTKKYPGRASFHLKGLFT